MTWTPATPTDIPAITAFLMRHIQTSMFPLTNLAEHGLGSDAQRALNIWIHWQDGAVRNLLMVTNEGMVMPQMPDTDSALMAQAAALLQGRQLIGGLGDPGPVRALLAACGADAAPTNVNSDEPGFTLNLPEMTAPDATGFRIETLDSGHQDLTTGWRRQYNVEVLGTPPEQAESQAQKDVQSFVRDGRHVVLFHNDQPVAMSGFNAVLRDVVQIGGVYTPPALRGRGYARRSVALHLSRARQSGVARAVLFAASDAAAAAYRAIGFVPAGAYALILFSSPQKVAPCR